MKITPAELFDATNRFAYRITAVDHVGAVQCSPTRCVAANGARRQRGVLDARIGAKIVKLLRRDGWHRYELSPASLNATEAYDRAGVLLPVGFMIELLPPSVPLGARDGEKPGSNVRSGKRESVATRSPSRRHVDVTS